MTDHYKEQAIRLELGDIAPMTGAVVIRELIAHVETLQANEQELEQVKADAAHKPNCKECAKWVQEQADNKEWIDGVAEGRRIVAELAAKETP